MYSVLLPLILVLVSLILIGYPIWKGRRGEGEQADGLSSLMATNEKDKSREKDVIMGALSEIEFDYHMKKLSEEDYRVLKNEYSKMALVILDAEDTHSEVTYSVGDTRSGKKDANNLDEIEREIEAELQALEVTNNITN